MWSLQCPVHNPSSLLTTGGYREYPHPDVCDSDSGSDSDSDSDSESDIHVLLSDSIPPKVYHSALQSSKRRYDHRVQIELNVQQNKDVLYFEKDWMEEIGVHEHQVNLLLAIRDCFHNVWNAHKENNTEGMLAAIQAFANKSLQQWLTARPNNQFLTDRDDVSEKTLHVLDVVHFLPEHWGVRFAYVGALLSAGANPLLSTENTTCYGNTEVTYSPLFSACLAKQFGIAEHMLKHCCREGSTKDTVLESVCDTRGRSLRFASYVPGYEVIGTWLDRHGAMLEDK